MRRSVQARGQSLRASRRVPLVLLSRSEVEGKVVQERVVLSPLRYPGGKRRLTPYLAATLKANDLEPDLFVEPFAGGASVALELLATGRVMRIGLAERDPYLAAFWSTVFFDSDWLCKKIDEIDVSLATWERLKRGTFTSRRNRALACLFLNRTSFNGTLHARAGPIGGKAQASTYKIDCRFPRERLKRRVRACAALSDRVAFIRDVDALDVLRDARRAANGKTVFFYLDPPFWAKADQLYRFSFTISDHKRLSTALRYVKEPYLLSYDPAPEVEALYAHHDCLIERVELLYGTQRSAGEELVIANVNHLPADNRLWRTHHEWTRLRRRRTSIRLPR
jgi:DNA adenine methylase